MNALHQSRCSNHPGREAVARCPECRQFFCRECIVEHEDVLICSECLRKQTQTIPSRTSRWHLLFSFVRGGAGLILAWLCFYGLGQLLLSLETNVHEGTVWKQPWWEK